MPPTPSVHRLQLGLPGSLILFAPSAFAPERQEWARNAPSPLVFFPISVHFTATPRIPVSSPTLKPGSMIRSSLVEPGALTYHLPGRLRALYAQ